MGFSGKNSYVLALMTLAFIIGEIAHFLIGKLTRFFSHLKKDWHRRESNPRPLSLKRQCGCFGNTLNKK
jgi:hypothetical protein